MKPVPDSPASDPTVIGEGADRPARRRRGLLIKSAISLGLIAFILSRVNIRQTFDVLLDAHIGLLALAGSLTVVGALLTASRWRILLAAQKVFTTTRHLVACWMTACFFNQFLPSTIGGDAIRIYESWKLGASKAGAAAVVAVDRLLGLFALMIFGVVALFLSSLLVEQHPEIRILVVGGALALGFVAAWIFYPGQSTSGVVNRLLGFLPGKPGRLANRFREALSAYQGRGGVLIKALMLLTALQFNVILFYFLVGSALDLQIAFLDYMLIIPVASVVLLLPVSINGVGLREAIFVLLLAAFGVPPEAAIAFAWASFGLFTLYGLIGGCVYAVRKDVPRRVG